MGAGTLGEPMTQLIAHRTCPLDAPENSREGILLAGRLGADAVEIDVRLTSDGICVLSHDRTTRRVTGERHVIAHTTAAELTGLRIAGSDETMLTLAEAARILPDGLDFAVDVKEERSLFAAIAELRAAGVLDRARLWGRRPGMVALASREAPDCQRALLHNTVIEWRALRYLEWAARVGATAVSVMDISLTPKVVERGHELGLFVNCWVRSAKIQPKVLECAPDAVVTDWIREARLWIVDHHRPQTSGEDTRT